MKTSGETCFCDHCGEMIYTDTGDPHNPRGYMQHRPYRAYTHVPWDIASANKGESAVLCLDCVDQFKTENE